MFLVSFFVFYPFFPAFSPFSLFSVDFPRLLTFARGYDKINIMKQEYLEGGTVVSAHGVRGILKVISYCDSPKVLAACRRVFLRLSDGRYEERAVRSASPAGGDDAVAMKNTTLYLSRADIPLPKGSYFIADLFGLPVIDVDTQRLYGTVANITDVPQGKLYTVRTEKGDVLLPGVKEFIKEVDPERGVFIRPIPGFFDEE